MEYPDIRTDIPPTSSAFPHPIIIAGPCSAETEEQVLEVASKLSQYGISYMRAGIWKPRTSPDSFEGIGVEALEWMKKAAETYGLKTTVEVANARHVEEVLKYDIDLLWIGARTTVNPFTVQEIADALKGVDKPVMIKNPVNPDLGLWSGAVKRFRRVGIEHLIACHRGFNVYNKTLLRNAPLWELPLEFKRLHPEIPLVCDPSHICGTREYIQQISQKALDLGFEGLMIETHPRPDEAWSDAKQQITPDTFGEILKSLKFKQASSDDIDFNIRVGNLRSEVDEVDRQLIELLSARLDIAKQIGELKRHNNVAFFQHNRWSEVLNHCDALAAKLGVDEEFIQRLFSLVHLESLEIQGE